MKYCLVVLTIINLSLPLQAQKLIDSTYIADKTKYFEVLNDKIVGDGSVTLEKIIKESQFIVYGERHNSSETSKFIKGIIPLLAQNNYNTLALEVGPHTAKKLIELSENPIQTVHNLKLFNTRYFNPEIGREPIPFFTGIEDAEFLSLASKYNFDIWGLDQEFYYSILFLTDELLKLEDDSSDNYQLKIKKQKVDVLIKNYFLKKKDYDSNEGVFKAILSEVEVKDFFKEFKSDEALQIIDDIKISWDIYNRWNRDSHVDRISYMRNNFLHNYSQEGSKPKVFVKVGQAHASKVISNGAYDLGHFINEIALDENSQCTTLNSWQRFYLNEEGKETDYLHHKAYARYKRFLAFGHKESWTIINLKSIREDILNGKVSLPTNGDYHALKELIDGYDYQLILPLDKRITYNVNF